MCNLTLATPDARPATTPTPAVRTIPHGSGPGVHWMSADPAGDIAEGRPTEIRICVLRKQRDGSYEPFVEFYFLGRDGTTGGWLLSRDADGSGGTGNFRTYHVDLRADYCDCPASDNNWRVACKHRRACAAGLKALGLNPITGKRK